jgi:hypothetical protein
MPVGPADGSSQDTVLGLIPPDWRRPADPKLRGTGHEPRQCAGPDDRIRHSATEQVSRGYVVAIKQTYVEV